MFSLLNLTIRYLIFNFGFNRKLKKIAKLVKSYWIWPYIFGISKLDIFIWSRNLNIIFIFYILYFTFNNDYFMRFYWILISLWAFVLLINNIILYLIAFCTKIIFSINYSNINKYNKYNKIISLVKKRDFLFIFFLRFQRFFNS